jgi:hypothetical protein
MRFIVHTCHSPTKQITPFTHISLVHDTFPIHFDKLVMDFGRVTFTFENQITEHTSQSAGLVIDMGLYNGADTSTNSLDGSSNTGDVTEGLMTALNLKKTSGQRPAQAGVCKWFLL